MALLISSLAATSASAQAWRGMGRIAGNVTDENKAPLAGVTVRATLPGAGETEVKTNKNGEWALGGIASGAWNLDFVKEGYETRQISVAITQTSRTPPIEIVLTKAAPTVDPNAEIRDGLLEGAGLMNRRQYADARRIYEDLLAKYPEVHQLHPLIARTYYGENRFDQAVEHLRLGLARDPENVELKLLLGNILVEKGDAEEGERLLESIDETAVKDPITFVNVGIALLNQDKPAEAFSYFDRAVTRFPDSPDGYYYRGIIHLQLGKTAEAKADLAKFLELAPTAPEAESARKILEQLKD